MKLDDLLSKLSGLPDAARQEVVASAMQITAGMCWVPNPGPQATAYFCQADELFYGGQAGGGKSDLSIGLGLTAHTRTLLLRRTNKEALGMVERIAEIAGSRDCYNGQNMVWRMPDGRNVDIGGCQLEEDKQKYKGTPHDLICVGRGTPVLMGNGAFKPVETVVVGDLVATLEGPRKVLRAFPTPVKPAVRVALAGGVSQIQSRSHRVLQRSGWVSPGTSGADHGHLLALCAKQSDYWRISQPTSLHTHVSAEQARHTTLLSAQNSGPQQLTARDIQCFASPPGLIVYTKQSLSETGCEGFDDEPPVVAQLPRFRRASSALQPLLRALDSLRAFHSAVVRGAVGALKKSILPDCPGDYLFGLHFCDARIHESSDHRAGQAPAQSCARQSTDAARPIPIYLQAGALAQTHTHNRRTWLYAHPYNLGRRSSQAPVAEIPYLITPVEDQVLFDLEVEEVNHFITDGGIINKNCFDEVSDFTESQYTFIIGWNRSADASQRCRVVATGNPPTRPEGLWVIKRWAAWLDPKHPKPAKPGELRWYTTGDDGKEIEVDGPGPHLIGGESIIAKSRTFIPAKLSDNPDLSATNYAAVLAGLPEELRAAYRDGRFDASLKDSAFQVIPTAWVVAAQARWKPDGRGDLAMTAMALDPAGGGRDSAELACRYGGWYAELVSAQGAETADGSSTAAAVVKHRRDNCPVVVDIGGGYGGAVTLRLQDNGIERRAFNGAEKSSAKTKDGQLAFANKRAEAWWKFREELDPDQEGGSAIALPLDPELLADLCAPTWTLKAGGILIESKDELRKRLGRSPGKGDAVVMCLSEGNAAAKRQRANSGHKPKVVMGYAATRRNR